MKNSLFKLTSLNLNGIRSATSKGLEAWLAQAQPDCICVQEVKAQAADVADVAGKFETLAGLKGHFHFAEKRPAHVVASAQAVVTVTYGPATTVPTLSEWGLLIMSALLAAFTIVVIRKGASSKTMASLGVAIVASFAAADGTKLFKDVYAFVPTWTLA
jgi:hypothetical protein